MREGQLLKSVFYIFFAFNVITLYKSMFFVSRKYFILLIIFDYIDLFYSLEDILFCFLYIIMFVATKISDFYIYNCSEQD